MINYHQMTLTIAVVPACCDGAVVTDLPQVTSCVNDDAWANEAERSRKRAAAAHCSLVPVHTPTHAHSTSHTNTQSIVCSGLMSI